MGLIHDNPRAERARLLKELRRTGRSDGDARLQLQLRLCSALLDGGRLASAETWLDRLQQRRIHPAGAFGIACLRCVIDHERYHASAFGACISSAALVARASLDAASPPDWHALLLATPFLPALADWCREQYLRVRVCQFRRSKLELRAARASSDAEQGAAYVAQWAPHANQLIHDLFAYPGLQAVAALELADWYHEAALVIMADRLLAFAAASNQTGTMAWRIARLRLDWQYGPLSTVLAWNLALRESERESNELAQSIERAQFGPAAIGQVQLDIDALAMHAGGTAPSRAAAEYALLEAYACALRGAFQEAAGVAAHARLQFAQIGEAQGVAMSGIIEMMASIGAGDTGAAVRVSILLADDRLASASPSWALGHALALARWGRLLQVRHGAYNASTACFAMAYQTVRAIALPIHAAQCLVDLANADKLIGYRVLACTRYRLAASTFLDDALANPDPHSVRIARLTFTLVETAMAYAFEADHEGVSLACQDLARMIELLEASPPAAPSDVQEHAHGLTYALSRLSFLGALAWLARILEAKREGDGAVVDALCVDAEAATDQLDPSDAAFFRLQLAIARNDTDAVDQAIGTAAEGVFSTGALAQLENYLATAPGELARAEYAIHLQGMRVGRMRLYSSARQYERALTELRALDALDARPWFDSLPLQRITGRADAAKVLLGAGEASASLELCLAAILAYEEIEAQLTDDTRRLNLLREPSVTDNYITAAAALQRLGQPAQAFDMADAGRARALRHLIRQRDASLSEASVGSAQETARQAVRTYEHFLDLRRIGSDGNAALNVDAYACGLSQLTLVSASTSGAADWQPAANMVRESALAEVASECAADTVVLSFSYADDVFLSWAANASGLLSSFMTTIEARLVNTWIRELLHCCRTPDAWPTTDADLGALFLAPLADAIRTARRVVIVSCGDALNVPFQLLPYVRGGSPLGLTHVVSYLPAASFLRLPPGPIDEAGEDLVMGYSEQAGDAIARELADVAATLGCTPVQTADMAREDIVALLTKARRIHVASHADHRTGEPWKSALTLCANASFTAAALSGYRFRARLVTLGGCATGVGTASNSDPTGFARAFLAGGAGACVLSLWDVDSHATGALMHHFYGFLQESDAPDRALARAQRLVHSGQATAAMQAGWVHPYFWAGFIITGAAAGIR